MTDKKDKLTILQRAELKAIEMLGGGEAGELATKGFEAGNAGDHLARLKLGIEAEGKMAGHMIDTVKEAVGKLNGFMADNPGTAIGTAGGLVGAAVGYGVQHLITGGENVERHDPVLAAPAKPSSKEPSPKR